MFFLDFSTCGCRQTTEGNVLKSGVGSGLGRASWIILDVGLPCETG